MNIERCIMLLLLMVVINDRLDPTQKHQVKEIIISLTREVVESKSELVGVVTGKEVQDSGVGGTTE